MALDISEDSVTLSNIMEFKGNCLNAIPAVPSLTGIKLKLIRMPFCSRTEHRAPLPPPCFPGNHHPSFEPLSHRIHEHIFKLFFRQSRDSPRQCLPRLLSLRTDQLAPRFLVLLKESQNARTNAQATYLSPLLPSSLLTASEEEPGHSSLDKSMAGFEARAFSASTSLCGGSAADSGRASISSPLFPRGVACSPATTELLRLISGDGGLH